MSSYIIAVDFDGTICENKYPAIGEPRRSTISYLKEKQKKEQNSSCGLVGLMSFLTRLLNGAATRD